MLYLATRTDLVTDLPLLLSWQTVRGVWSDPALLATGLSLSLPTILILLCHELGHYLACRYYGYPVSPPYFLPAPFGLGTLGAFIRIGAPVRSKRELFDIGAAGPLAGFVALLPFLVWGVAASRPVPLPPPPAGVAEMVLLVPGRSLGLTLTTSTARCRRATSSICIPSPWRPGSGSWPRRSISCRWGSSTAATSSTPSPAAVTAGWPSLSGWRCWPSVSPGRGGSCGAW